MRRGRIRGLEWTEARVRNYKKTVKFYRDVLGLKLVFEEDDKDFIQFSAGKSTTYLALLGVPKNSSSSNFVPTLEVDDIDAAVDRLRTKGVKFITRILEFTHIRLVEFVDPEGNRLQLFEWKKKKE